MKTVVITGATSGIGLSVAREMIQYDYTVIGVGRSPERCKKAKSDLLSEFPGKPVEYVCADLMNQSEVRRAAGEIGRYLEKYCSGRLHALINNAGCVRSWYSTTEDGYEQQFALNHLAGFLLTHLLMPYLRAAGGRVLLTSSNSHKMMRMRWNDLMFQKHYHPLLVYKQSKLCNLLFAYAFNQRFAAENIRAYGIDPGLVRTEIGHKQTGSLVHWVWSLQQLRGVSPEVPAKTYAWICEQEPKPERLYFYLCSGKPTSKQVTRENAERLFQRSEQLCGIRFGGEGI